MTKEKKIIHIAADHAGYQYKELIKDALLDKGYDIVDHGTDSEQSMDYPDVVHQLAGEIDEDALGILICGSGNGVAMTANKYQHIRAGLAWDTELARLTRAHNNANVLALPARFVTSAKAIAVVHEFLKTDFEGGRHDRRVAKIACV